MNINRRNNIDISSLTLMANKFMDDPKTASNIRNNFNDLNENIYYGITNNKLQIKKY